MDVDAKINPTRPPFSANHQDQSLAKMPPVLNEFPALMKKPLIPPTSFFDDDILSRVFEAKKEPSYVVLEQTLEK